MNPISELITILETEKINGVKYQEISPENLDFLNNVKSPDRSVSQAVNKPEIPQPESKKRVSTTIPDATPLPSPEPVKTDHMERLDCSFAELADLVSSCQKCLFCQSSKQRMSGSGDPNADLMFIGDSPEKEDDESNQLLIGPAGKLLTNIIKAMKFTLDNVYITNVIKCYPQGKKLVNDDENVNKCIPYLKREIELIQPKVIVLLGPVSLKYVLGKSSIANYRGQWQKYNGIDCMPTYHPSYLVRLPAAKRDVWNDMQQVMTKFGLQP